MIGLEVTHRAWLTDEHADALRPTGRAGRFVAELLDHFVGFHQQRFGWEGGPIHDAVTIAHLIDPTLVTALPMNVQIETRVAPVHRAARWPTGGPSRACRPTPSSAWTSTVIVS